MGANLQEWEFYVSDRGQTPGGSPPDINDDTGVVYALTPTTADSPTVYTDQNGTVLTETEGVAKMTLANGHVRFWTDRTVSNLDIAWFGSETCGYLQNAHFSRHELPATAKGDAMGTVIPIQNSGANNVETSLGFSFPNGVFVRVQMIGVTSAGSNTISTTFDLGIAASAAGGDANGFLVSQHVGLLRVGVRSALGVLSHHAMSGLDQQLTYTPASAVHSTFGALVYMDVRYGLES